MRLIHSITACLGTLTITCWFTFGCSDAATNCAKLLNCPLSGPSGSTGGAGGGEAPATSSSSAGSGGGMAGNGGNGGNSCTQEICNGQDDDCDDVVDNGCPAIVVMADSTFSGHAVYGSEAGRPFVEVCPPGSAMYRIAGHLDEGLTPPVVQQLQGYCAMLELIETTDVTPFEYSLVRGDSLPPLTPHGSPTGTPFLRTCPENEFMIGMSGFMDPIIGLQQIRIHCSEIVIHDDGSSFTIAHRSAISVVGPIPQISEDFVDTLPSPKVVDRIQGFVDIDINAAGVGEALPILILK